MELLWPMYNWYNFSECKVRVVWLSLGKKKNHISYSLKQIPLSACDVTINSVLYQAQDLEI